MPMNNTAPASAARIVLRIVVPSRSDYAGQIMLGTTPLSIGWPTHAVFLHKFLRPRLSQSWSVRVNLLRTQVAPRRREWEGGGPGLTPCQEGGIQLGVLLAGIPVQPGAPRARL